MPNIINNGYINPYYQSYLPPTRFDNPSTLIEDNNKKWMSNILKMPKDLFGNTVSNNLFGQSVSTIPVNNNNLTSGLTSYLAGQATSQVTKNPSILSDLGKFLGGNFSKLFGQGGTDVVKNLTNFSTFSPNGLISLGGSLAGIGLEALGVNKANSNNLSGFDKALGFASKLPIPNPVVSGVLTGVNLLNQHAGKTSKKQGTADMGSILGYGQADVNQNANTKYTLSDTIKGWFGKSKREKTNDLTKYYDASNILKSIPGYDYLQNMRAANNSVSHISQRNLQQLYGGVSTNMLAARKGTKLHLRRIIDKASPHNVIPDGAFHSRKNNLPEEISEQVTSKGIPVITEEDGGKIKQHAEIERNEIIFHKGATDKIEHFLSLYNKAEDQKEKDRIATECGKYIAHEILLNTKDNTGLIDNIK